MNSYKMIFLQCKAEFKEKHFKNVNVKGRLSKHADFGKNADACIVVLYISFLVQKNVSVSVLDSNFFKISWKHDFNLVKNPCKENVVVFTIGGARRILSKPVKKKEPVKIEVMKMLYKQFGNSQELAKIRIYCMFSLSFSGFF